MSSSPIYKQVLAMARQLSMVEQQRLVADLSASPPASVPEQHWAPVLTNAAEPEPTLEQEDGPFELIDQPGTSASPLMVSNGVVVETGCPVVRVDGASVRRLLRERGVSRLPNVAPLHEQRITLSKPSLGMIYGKSYMDLAEAGWALVVPAHASTELIKALLPLVQHRSVQQGITLPDFTFPAGETCAQWVERYAPPNRDLPSPWHPKRSLRLPVITYRPDQDANTWLAANGVALGVVNPQHGVPFYLLLVGPPGPCNDSDQDYIPFVVQYDLDIFYGVGRLCFTTPDGQYDYTAYTAYAEQLVQFEGRHAPYERHITYFATDHDEPTHESLDQLVRPLAIGNEQKGLVTPAQARGFTQHVITGQEASRAALCEVLRGKAPGGKPALLFSATHGAKLLNHTSPNLPMQQGALVCSDWGGVGPLTDQHWLDAAGLPADMDVSGLIAICFACFGLGCPRHDTYAAGAGRLRQIAPRDLIAALPQQLLARGALAVIGHIDVAWSYSFSVPELGVTNQTQGFDSLLQALMAGERLGYATDPFNLRQAAFAGELGNLVKNIKMGMMLGDIQSPWRAYHDARSYAVLGDPAVRLPFQPAPAPLSTNPTV